MTHPADISRVALRALGREALLHDYATQLWALLDECAAGAFDHEELHRRRSVLWAEARAWGIDRDLTALLTAQRTKRNGGRTA